LVIETSLYCDARSEKHRINLVLLYNIEAVPIRIFVCEVNKYRFEKSSKKNHGFVLSYDMPAFLRSMLPAPSR
jgi:hypothetical protein